MTLVTAKSGFNGEVGLERFALLMIGGNSGPQKVALI